MLLCSSNLLRNINHKHQFVKLENNKGKAWLLPLNNIKRALSLYQPSSNKGKLLKYLLPMIKWFGPIYSLKSITKVNYVINTEVLEIIYSVFGQGKGLYKTENKTELIISLFLGTPGTHQKIVLQIANTNRILGYCKISNNNEVCELFKNEKNMLHLLGNEGLNNIPKCLYCGNIRSMDNSGIFIQSTSKTYTSRTAHTLQRKHFDFLKDLYKSSCKTTTFKASQFYRSIEVLKQSYNKFIGLELDDYKLDDIRYLLDKVIERIISEFSLSDVRFGVCHRDFTPWNTYVQHGKIYVFDWEYTKDGYPPMMDMFHFFTQCQIHERKAHADLIWSEFQSKKDIFDEELLSCSSYNSNLIYACYLVDIISLYLIRDEGNYSLDIAKNIGTWLDLLKYIIL